MRARHRLTRRTNRRLTGFTAVVLAGTLTLLAGCGGGGSPAWQGDGPTEARPKASATITSPADGATDVPASTEITFTVADAVTTEVELTDAAGKTVEGDLTPEGAWLPNRQLDYGTTYTATVTATGDDGKPAMATATFTTMAQPSRQVRVSSFLGDDAVVGVGMPLIIRFSRSIPKDYRDDVQRRMTVRSDPPQEGVWHWVSGTEVRYRPKTFWQANTTISYKVQTGGLPMGDGWYGRNDLTVDLKVGRALVLEVDNRTKLMTVTQDGEILRTIPISLGKPRTPSSSGTMVIMEKFEKTVFDTSDAADPRDRYVIDIQYAQRLTYGGEFIHAAPWSVADQGIRNVSHGCVNMSTANAQWLFERTRLGDPITVKGTERTLRHGNGWTDWNLSWEEYVKGSALPYEPSDN
ncbi:MAG TPA: Ig-like domain-containing protein [Micromonosporaceae bacterium]